MTFTLPWIRAWRWRVTLVVVAAMISLSTARADVVWVGDFESGDASQYSYRLNDEVDGERFLSFSSDIVAQGRFSARLELGNNARWPNGAKRIELQHLPAKGRTAARATTYFAWSFYLPSALPKEPKQQIGYWESDKSYQQVMSFEVEGETLRFWTRQPTQVLHWEDAVATPNKWHRIAMRVDWSTDPAAGHIDIWFDGIQVVHGVSAQTLFDSNPHFIQFGLWRDPVEFTDRPVIYIDNAVEGDSLDEVLSDERLSDERLSDERLSDERLSDERLSDERRP